MFIACSRMGDVDAADVAIENGPFFCPGCKKPVILKQGPVRDAHFAHLAGSTCTYGAGESETHRSAKRGIKTALGKHPLVSDLHLEYPLGDVRPDIYFRFANRYSIAVEVQLSTLSSQELARRTRSYFAQQIFVLWTPPYSNDMVEGKRYAPSFWEKYLHALYFGRVYYWLSGETMLPVHFAPYELGYKQKYYDEKLGRWRTPTSPRFRVLYFLPAVRITQLQAIIRQAWESSHFLLPAARLWALSQPNRQGYAPTS
jgi:competence protein CoiA